MSETIYTFILSDNLSNVLNLPCRRDLDLSDQAIEQLIVEQSGKYPPGSQKGELNAHYGKRHSEETKKLLSEKAKQRPTRNLSQETKDKISKSNKGKTHTIKTKQKMSESKIGSNNPMFGKRHSDESKEKVRQAKLGKKRPEHVCRALSDARKNEIFECEHCGIITNSLNYKRWHGEKCKHVKTI